MQRTILRLLISTRLMAVLFLGYAIAMATGTFIESEYTTDTARLLVYNTWWFEAIHILFLINFIGNIKRYQLHLKEKWVTLLLHLSFIFILLGAGITRYISYEGVIHIREKESANQLLSDKLYMTLWVDGTYQGSLKRRSFEDPLLLSPICDPDYEVNTYFDQTAFSVKAVQYIPDAKKTIAPNPKGKTYIKLVESGSGKREEHWLEAGKVNTVHQFLIAVDMPTNGAINIDTRQKTLSSPFEGQFMRMADRSEGKVLAGVVQPLQFRSLYSVAGLQFVFPEQPVVGQISYVTGGDFKSKKAQEAIELEVQSGSEMQRIMVVGSKGTSPEPVHVKMNGLEFTLSLGSKEYTLPFSIRLNDFVAIKYPGTEKSYASFESKVTVLDGKTNFDAQIYMNHVLDYKGYRLFQASFDPDELGTILSVNHDFWGTLFTYIGYFMLFFALMALLFNKHTRFASLKNKLAQVKAQKIAMVLLLLGGSFGMQAQAQPPHRPKPLTVNQYIDSLHKYQVPETQAAQFGRLIIQDDGGRMKPINTFSSELLRKVSKHDTYEGMNSDQVFISMRQFPFVWMELPIIYVKTGNDSIRRLLGVKAADKYIPFKAFFDNRGNYKLEPFLDEAYKTNTPNQFQKDYIEADKRINLMNRALFGGILRVFPVPNNKDNKWVSNLELESPTGTALDSIKTALPYYLEMLHRGSVTHDYTFANTLLNGMKSYQKKYGKAVMPSEQKVEAEIMYNHYDVFKNLFWMYMLTGVVMLLLVILAIFFKNRLLHGVIQGFHVIAVLLFVLHTAGLITRWYISGHAPWSDAYESMIYVGWAIQLFTLTIDPKSKLTVASGTFVASMILMIAHWNWMDPAIANLQPVLNSYWLMIHVAVIVASYGPFTLGMVLGVVGLLLMCLMNAKNRDRLEWHLKEITYINEMALTVGLVMLTIGNFLGGQWANESWGRYWGWDPKETWALISIMIYAFVIHARLVPGLRGKWFYNVMSIFAFYSILMTYFGVNFYLTGLHSYASGDKVVTPSFVYISVLVLVVLSTFAFFRYKKASKG
ncbi:MAG: cytochrome C biogenesis protein [Flavobacterium sp. BFFFF2]|nr:MAG: cytochrome C biogenesis protein [Flavobacterium sp. BFFFF2]